MVVNEFAGVIRRKSTGDQNSSPRTSISKTGGRRFEPCHSCHRIHCPAGYPRPFSLNNHPNNHLILIKRSGDAYATMDLRYCCFACAFVRRRSGQRASLRPLHGCGSCLAERSGKRIESPAIIVKRVGRATLGYLSGEKFFAEMLHGQICPINRCPAFKAAPCF